jgi:hypothetical protein
MLENFAARCCLPGMQTEDYADGLIGPPDIKEFPVYNHHMTG